MCRDFNSKVSPREVLLFLMKDRWHSCYFCLLPEINQVYVLAQISFYRVSVLESVLEHEEDLILLLFFNVNTYFSCLSLWLDHSTL